jgi:dTDP-4-dehydrorhamnose 3,5-epimerase-like enzyme
MNLPWLDFSVKGDERGLLIALEAGRQIPFEMKRIYYIYGTQPGVIRGLHAHKKLRQAAVCVQGGLTLLLDDGKDRVRVRLDRPNRGILIEPMIWHEMVDFTEDCVMLVMAEDYYDESDYIRSYETFKKLCE